MVGTRAMNGEAPIGRNEESHGAIRGRDEMGLSGVRRLEEGVRRRLCLLPTAEEGEGDAAAPGADVGRGREDGAGGGGARRALLLHAPPRAPGRRPHRLLLVDYIHPAMAIS